MRALLTRRNIVIVSIAVIIAIIAAVFVNSGNGEGFITDGVTTVTNPLNRMAASIARTFERIYGYMYEYEQLVEENESLKNEIAEFSRENNDLIYYREEVAKLREMLKLQEKHSDWEFISASVLQWSASNWASSFTINIGSANTTVKVGDAITTEKGVMIGKVTAVGSLESTCVSVIDTTFAASVSVGSLGAEGTAKGDFSLMRDGSLKISNISDDAAVFTGDLVVTSGRGGIFPEGLTLGTVTGVRAEESGLGTYAVVSPMAELAGIMNVYVVVNFTPVK